MASWIDNSVRPLVASDGRPGHAWTIAFRLTAPSNGRFPPVASITSMALVSIAVSGTPPSRSPVRPGRCQCTPACHSQMPAQDSVANKKPPVRHGINDLPLTSTMLADCRSGATTAVRSQPPKRDPKAEALGLMKVSVRSLPLRHVYERGTTRARTALGSLSPPSRRRLTVQAVDLAKTVAAIAPPGFEGFAQNLKLSRARVPLRALRLLPLNAGRSACACSGCRVG